MLKSLGKLFVVAVIFCLTCGTSALAENRAGATTLTPLVGYHSFDSDLNLDDTASYGIGVGYNFTPEWAVELDLRFTPTEADDDSYFSNDFGGFDVDVWTLGVSGLYHFQPSEALNPYLAVGLGGVVYEFDEHGNDEDYMLYWGGGFKYAVNENAALRLDVRHILDNRNDNVGHDQDGQPEWANHFLATVGMTFQFGGYGSKPLMK